MEWIARRCNQYRQRAEEQKLRRCLTEAQSELDENAKAHKIEVEGLESELDEISKHNETLDFKLNAKEDQLTFQALVIKTQELQIEALTASVARMKAQGK